VAGEDRRIAGWRRRAVVIPFRRVNSQFAASSPFATALAPIKNAIARKPPPVPQSHAGDTEHAPAVALGDDGSGAACPDPSSVFRAEG